MAKGNLFLGDARGSVGDVTFYRKNGEQISRQRIRTIANPSTNGQLLQRAITATIAQAYKAGSVIIDHAFQDKEFGQKSQAYFQKLNFRLLRDVAAAELENDTPAASGQAAFVVRSAAYPTPWMYQVSEGKLQQNLFTIAEQSGNQFLLEASLAAVGSATTLGEYCAANNLVAEDIFTLVGFGIVDPNWSSSDPGALFHQFRAFFGFARLKVKDTAIGSSTAIGSATYGDLFELDQEFDLIDMTQALTAAIPLSSVVERASTGTLGVIRSRDNSTQRSTCILSAPSVLRWGVKTSYLFGAWNPKPDPVVQSDRILEGGGFQ